MTPNLDEIRRWTAANRRAIEAYQRGSKGERKAAPIKEMRDDDPRHGTRAGADAHRRARQPLCRPCRDAYAAYKREWARQKRERA